MTQTAISISMQIAALLPRLRRFARAITRNLADADDLAQLAIERALIHADQWQPGSSLETWVYRIMKNAWIDEIRTRVRRDRLFDAEEAGALVGDNSAQVHQQQLAVRQAMQQLSDEHRLVVALVLIDGMSYKEAAEVLDIPIGTLTSRLARARDALQNLLTDTARTT